MCRRLPVGVLDEGATMRPGVAAIGPIAITRCQPQNHAGGERDGVEIGPDEGAGCQQRHQRARRGLIFGDFHSFTVLNLSEPIDHRPVPNCWKSRLSSSKRQSQLNVPVHASTAPATGAVAQVTMPVAPST